MKNFTEEIRRDADASLQRASPLGMPMRFYKELLLSASVYAVAESC